MYQLISPISTKEKENHQRKQQSNKPNNKNNLNQRFILMVNTMELCQPLLFFTSQGIIGNFYFRVLEGQCRVDT